MASPVFAWLSFEQRVDVAPSFGDATACTTRLMQEAEPLWRSAVTEAAKNFASQNAAESRVRLARARGHADAVLDSSIDALADTTRLSVVLTDATIVRTGGDCPSVLLPPPSAGSTGFIRFVQLLSGPAQRLRWWRPHPAYPGQDVNTTVHTGSLWVHHARSHFDAAAAAPVDAGAAAVWAIGYLWFAPSNKNPAARSPALRTQGTVHTLWEVPTISAADAALWRAAAVLWNATKRGALPEPKETRDSGSRVEDEADCVREPRAQPVRLAVVSSEGKGDGNGGDGGDGQGGDSVESALRSVMDAAVSHATAIHPSLPPLHVTRIMHWRLPPRIALPPQPAATGLVRAIFILSPVSSSSRSRRRSPDRDITTSGGAAAAGRLRLHLLDPRPPAVRLPVLSLAEWPFGMRNGHAAPLTPAGTMLLVPTGMSLASAALNSSRAAAHWLEMHLDRSPTPSCTARPALLDVPPPPALQSMPPALQLTPPVTTRSFHATTVSIRRRDDAASLDAIAAAALVIRQHARTEPSANVSNVGGWQSRADYLMDEPKVMRALYPIVYDALIAHLASAAFSPRTRRALSKLDVRLSGWANANSVGDTNAPHEHADQDWNLSGVLYLDDGGDDTCALRLHSPLPPTPSHGRALSGPVAVGPAAPVAGTSIVFPAWLSHWVPPHCGHRQRLSVAFNAAALVPGRMWPDGSSAQPAPGLADALKKRRGASGSRAEAIALWPLEVTLAYVPPSVLIHHAWEALAATADDGRTGASIHELGECIAGSTVGRCCVAIGEDVPGDDRADECTPCADAKSGSAVLRSLGAALESSIHYRGVKERPAPRPALYEIHACALSAGQLLDSEIAQRSLDAVAPSNREPTAVGTLLLPTSALADTDSPLTPAGTAGFSADTCSLPASWRLVLPDARTAAGDLASHVHYRRTLEASADRAGDGDDATDASIVLTDGAVFVVPAWARAVAVRQPSEQCDGAAPRRTVFFRAVER